MCHDLEQLSRLGWVLEDRRGRVAVVPPLELKVLQQLDLALFLMNLNRLRLVDHFQLELLLLVHARLRLRKRLGRSDLRLVQNLLVLLRNLGALLHKLLRREVRGVEGDPQRGLRTLALQQLLGLVQLRHHLEVVELVHQGPVPDDRLLLVLSCAVAPTHGAAALHDLAACCLVLDLLLACGLIYQNDMVEEVVHCLAALCHQVYLRALLHELLQEGQVLGVGPVLDRQHQGGHAVLASRVDVGLGRQGALQGLYVAAILAGLQQVVVGLHVLAAGDPVRRVHLDLHL
mmetsp:Transcript_43902/g.136634  ORF Transcript_43902/g.136634 Transcript_43902/m.136634 type:complete len:288 (-) Transcript_43902:80-943(-)